MFKSSKNKSKITVEIVARTINSSYIYIINKNAIRYV